MKNPKSYLFLFSVLLLFSCSDPEKDESEIIGSWNIVAYESRTENPPTDWSPYQACRLDDMEDYSSDGAWTHYDGTNQCEGGNGIGIYKGTWKLAANDTKVIFTYQGVPGEYENTIETLSKSTMILSFSSGTTDGRQNRVTYSKN